VITARRAAGVALTAIVLGAPAPSTAAAGGSVSAAGLRDRLASHAVVLRNVRISGTLDLRPLGEIRHQFVCRDCLFQAGLIGAGVIFDRALDLSGSRINGAVRMQEARFLGPVLFGSPPGDRGTEFVGPADFRLVSLGDLVTFEGATFERPATFTLARFATDSVFTHARFHSAAIFERAAFGTGVDFRLAHFDRGAGFAGARFAGNAEFSSATFTRQADFDLAQFARDGIFFGTRFFGGAGSRFAAHFERTTAGGTLDFSNAVVGGPAWFRGMTADGVISFAGAVLPDDRSLVLTNLAARDLYLCADCVLRSVQPYDEAGTLRLIESSAKARGDLSTANSADYSFHVLRSRDYAWPRHWLDAVFYRGVAGYFVRPLRPLVTLLVLAAAISLVRFHRNVSATHPPLRAATLRARLRAEVHAVPRLFGEYLDTLTHSFHRLPESSRGAGLVGLRLEVLVYRTLLVCVLLGLANSNPTLRQMVDALR
jgi:hypothetical protein